MPPSLVLVPSTSYSAEESDADIYKHIVNFGRILEVPDEVRLTAASTPPATLPHWLLRHIPALRHWDVWRRGVVSLAAMSVYLILQRVRLPGIDASLLAATQGSVPQGIATVAGSVMHLGVSPAISASIVLSGLTAAILPKWIRNSPAWRSTYMYKEKGAAFEKAHQSEVFMWTMVLGLVEACGAAWRLQTVTYRASLGSWFGTVSVFMIGTLVAIKLTNIISKRGLGEGMSVLICSGIFRDVAVSAGALATHAAFAIVSLPRVQWPSVSMNVWMHTSGFVHELGRALSPWAMHPAAQRLLDLSGILGLWIILVVLIVRTTQWEWRVPLRMFKIGGAAQGQWRESAGLDASTGAGAAAAGLALPVRLAANATLIFIFAQALVYNFPMAMTLVIPSFQPVVAAFFVHPYWLDLTMVSTIFVMQFASGVGSALAADKYLRSSQTGVNARLTPGIVRKVKREQRTKLARLQRLVATRGVERLEKEQVAELMQLEAVVEGRTDSSSNHQQTRQLVPPGREQYFYLLDVCQRANLVGGGLLSAIYVLAKGTDQWAMRLLGVELHSVSLLIVASFVISLRTQVTSMLGLDRARDEGGAALGPLRSRGPLILY